MAATFSSLAQRQEEEMEANRVTFGDLTERWSDTVDAVRSSATASYESDRVEFVKSFENASDHADFILGELRRKLSIASDESLSAAYGNRATSEDETANTLRMAAIGFGVATVAMAVVSLVWAARVETDPARAYDALALLPLKFGVIALLGGIGAYLGRQSERHRSFGRRLRVNQLELHNIGSYLAELDPAERAAIKTKLVDSFFGQGADDHKDDAPTAGASVEELVSLLRTSIAR